MNWSRRPETKESQANKMAKTVSTVSFKAKLHRPSGADKGAPWTFLNLPQDASDKLPSRSMVSVEGTFNGFPFQTTLVPDGQGGHWLKVDQKLREASGAKVGEAVELEISPAAKEPEPEVPEDVRKALEAAGPKAMATWGSITPVARRDWIFWITSGKKAETRLKRIEVACSKLAAGNRRPCCFDRSGMYDKSLSCPMAESSEE
jgi:hypothetical protein